MSGWSLWFWTLVGSWSTFVFDCWLFSTVIRLFLEYLNEKGTYLAPNKAFWDPEASLTPFIIAVWPFEYYLSSRAFGVTYFVGFWISVLCSQSTGRIFRGQLLRLFLPGTLYFLGKWVTQRSPRARFSVGDLTGGPQPWCPLFIYLFIFYLH